MADQCVNMYLQKRRKVKVTNCRDISLLSLSGKVYAKCFEKKYREIVKPQLQDAQFKFRPGRSIMEQIFALQQVFEKTWKYTKEVYTELWEYTKEVLCRPCKSI